MGEVKQTSLPWHVAGKQSIRGCNGEYIAKANWRDGAANAEFIVRAANAHYDLLSDMENAIRTYLDARGLVMVPREASADMLAEGMDRYARHDDAEEDVDGIYRAMLAAAPDPFAEDNA